MTRTVEAFEAPDSRMHELKATLDTVQWGAFDASTEPVLRIRSGDIVDIECLTHHAGDAPDLLMDDAVRAIYEAIPPAKRTPGVHIITGPIHVEGAEVGDTLECRALAFAPRLRYGSNFLANWACCTRSSASASTFSSTRPTSTPDWLALSSNTNTRWRRTSIPAW